MQSVKNAWRWWVASVEKRPTTWCFLLIFGIFPALIILSYIVQAKFGIPIAFSIVFPAVWFTVRKMHEAGEASVREHERYKALKHIWALLDDDKR